MTHHEMQEGDTSHVAVADRRRAAGLARPGADDLAAGRAAQPRVAAVLRPVAGRLRRPGPADGGADGRLRMFELVDNLQWEQSRLSHHVARMQRRGLVAREECTSDKRGAFVVLTDAGRDAIEKAAPGHVDTVRRLVFDGLSAEQVV